MRKFILFFIFFLVFCYGLMAQDKESDSGKHDNKFSMGQGLSG
jgi:hypothetical protein